MPFLLFFLCALAATPAPAAPMTPVFVKPILAKARALYAPEAAKLGLTFRIELLENSEHVVASADRTSREVSVSFHGGLLRSPRLTADGFRMILCHELGHIFGGDPRRPNPPEFQGPTAPNGLSFMSAEGQADYFASRECFRRLVAGDGHPIGPGSSPRAKMMCENKWGLGSTESLVCRRAAAGALDFLNLVMKFPISLEAADTSVAPRTLTGEYPPRQCRLDTMLAGALDAERPACWFKK